MKNQPSDLKELLANLKDEDYCYLTTTGRVSGHPHEIEIWFGLQNSTLYLLSGGRDESDWVKNLLKIPAVSLRIKKHLFSGTARLVSDEKEDALARRLLAAKYERWREGKSLSEWARTALPVAIDLIY